MKLRLFLLSLLALLLIAAAEGAAATGYDLSWWTVDSGGGTSSSAGGNYTLSGTIGQPDAGAAMNGSGYSLAGGFWAGAMNQYSVYLPLVSK
jgi:hypothetical protein